jgi:hypothetical protein
MERYRLVEPGATSAADHHWYINDMEKGYAILVLDGDFPDAEDVARYAFAKLTKPVSKEKA